MTVPSARVRTPPEGIDETVMVRESPSASVGAPILKAAPVSSVKLNAAFEPIEGAVLVFPTGAGELLPPPPPPPHAASASIAKLLNKNEEGPFNLKDFFIPLSSSLSKLIN